MQGTRDEVGSLHTIPAPDGGGRHTIVGRFNPGEDRAIGANGGILDVFRTRRKGEALPSIGPGPAEATLGKDAMTLIGEGDWPTKFIDGPEISRGIARGGWMGARVIRTKSFGQLLGIGPSIAVTIQGVG
jgi:hypothetical protein